MLFLSTREEMAWLCDNHTLLACLAVCAILHGSANTPSKIELYARRHHQGIPTILVPKDGGGWDIVQKGEVRSFVRLHARVREQVG